MSLDGYSGRSRGEPYCGAEREPVGNHDYDGLPPSVRALYTFEQYQWLSGDEKGRLIQNETEPECEL